MAKNLVIVESPAKAKTIKKFLGNNYHVMASNGHVRDLPKSQLGVDIKNDFTPHYITIRGKGELLSALRSEVAKADKVFLATDPDREGEAISWHLKAALNLADKDVHRVTFNEITKSTVKAAIKAPRQIDLALVDAQQARRVLDRIVGYEISPILWKKVKRGLSAGRVQNAALKILRDREDEINDFVKEEFWTIEASFKASAKQSPVKTTLSKINGAKADKLTQKEAEELLDRIHSDMTFLVGEIKTGHRIRRSPDPFTTSTLQQEASKRLNFTPTKTMNIAQQLYEGVEIPGQGPTGLITYLRTDSIRIADEMKVQAKDYIQRQYGKEYTSKTEAKAKTGGRIQDAHEAIRPSYLTIEPKAVEKALTRDQYRLYQLIFDRFLASQMADAEYETHTLSIVGGDLEFDASGASLTFPGFLKVYKGEEEEEGSLRLTGLAEGKPMILEDAQALQHFTQPPARFTEGTLVRALEENGIGRPSTYAPTIATLTMRHYVSKEKKALYVTELGFIVDDIIAQYFDSIHDLHFTAELEKDLDQVEEGMDWKEIVRRFYGSFEPQVEKAAKELEKIKIEDEPTDVICDKCGRNMVLKMGRFGKFYACPGFPECRNTKPYFEMIEALCPKCGGHILVKKTKKGRTYYGCENSPACDFMSWNKPTEKVCPVCQGMLYEKRGRERKLVCMTEGCGYQEKLEDDSEE